MARVISFDIDGTLEMGEPPGSIRLEVVRRALSLGFITGSCSDRPIGVQQMLWRDRGIKVNFTVLKQNLAAVREQFAAVDYLHFGDTLVDRMMAEEAGFDFVHVLEDDLAGALRRLSLD